MFVGNQLDEEDANMSEDELMDPSMAKTQTEQQMNQTLTKLSTFALNQQKQQKKRPLSIQTGENKKIDQEM